VILTNLTVSPSDGAVEFRRRNRPFEEKTVTPGALSDYEPLGWREAKRSTTSVRIRLDRKPDENLENRFWCCLYRLGYPELNIGRNFQIPIADGKDPVRKQIDVFARDDETVVIAECKTAEEYKKKSIQKDLGEFHANKKSIADALRKHYGRDFKPKIIWAFVIDNMSLTQEDKARAAEYKIAIITDRELTYFEEISKALAGAARQQFKAEYLAGQTIPALEDTKIPATRIKLGGTPAYVFSAKASDVLRRAFVNHRDLRDPASAPTYQRLVNPNRLGKIANFLSEDGFFPNSLLLSLQKKPRFDPLAPTEDKDIAFGYLYLPSTYKSIKVVDGQHRLYACAVLPEDTREPTLVFVALEAISGSQEATLFATINKEQQKVPKKLLDELDGDLKWDSEDPKERIAAIASRAVDLMNAEFHGPFEDKVVSPGLKASDDRPLTLPEVKKAIVSAGLIGKVISQGIVVPGPFFAAEKGSLSSREALDRLIDGLNQYFAMVRGANEERWEAGREGQICNNFGVPGHIRLLSEIVKYIEKRDGVTAHELPLKDLLKQIRTLLEPVLTFIAQATPDDIRKRFKVTLGGGGARQYYFALSQIVNEQELTFKPTGFQEWRSELSKEEQERADQEMRWIQDTVHGHVIEKLRQHYGEKFFDRGISNKEIKLKAHDKRMSEDEKEQDAGPEKYLDFLDLRKVVEQKENWPLFEATLNIKLPDQNKGQSKFIKWFDEINKIRRIPAHPYQRVYTQTDLDTIALVMEHLRNKISPSLANLRESSR
jgi:DNA sulfur modification protein DndB